MKWSVRTFTNHVVLTGHAVGKRKSCAQNQEFAFLSSGYVTVMMIAVITQMKATAVGYYVTYNAHIEFRNAK